MTRALNLTWGDCFFLGAIFLALLMLWMKLTYGEPVSVAHASGQAAYIKGEACVVNYQPVEEMAIQMGWCLDQRRLEDE